MNGVYINGERIAGEKPHEIKPGDHICFGVAIQNKNINEFEYIFEMVPCLKKRRLEFGESSEKEAKVRKILQENDDDNTENVPGPSGENSKVCQGLLVGILMLQ